LEDQGIGIDEKPSAVSGGQPVVAGKRAIMTLAFGRAKPVSERSILRAGKFNGCCGAEDIAQETAERTGADRPGSQDLVDRVPLKGQRVDPRHLLTRSIDIHANAQPVGGILYEFEAPAFEIGVDLIA
jgi:hypothetical protein